MKVVALLVWYDEPPDLLAACVASWSRVCDSVVAIDGAWEGFPDGAAESPAEQGDAIKRAARRSGMEWLLFSAREVWPDQPAKRTFAWRRGETLTEATDWFVVLDADEELVEGSRESLATIDGDVGLVTAHIDIGPSPQPRVLRALRGVKVEGLHYRYAVPDGRFLWNYPDEPQEAAAETDLLLRHRRGDRGEERLERQAVYYRERVER